MRAEPRFRYELAVRVARAMEAATLKYAGSGKAGYTLNQ
jgi:hypothetical protein